MTLPRPVAVLALLVPLCAPAAAQDDPAPAVSTPCATCHGGDGDATMPGYPDLAGQDEQYLVSALKAYRAGQRQGGMAGLMIPMAKTLSDEDIRTLARYYAALDPQ